MWFSSKPNPPPSTPTPTSEFSDLPPDSSDSTSVKNAIIKQIVSESNTNNARLLVEKINETCFERCVPTPGASISGAESKCVTQCMEKYMMAWNQVHAAYRQRLQQEATNQQIG